MSNGEGELSIEDGLTLEEMLEQFLEIRDEAEALELSLRDTNNRLESLRSRSRALEMCITGEANGVKQVYVTDDAALLVDPYADTVTVYPRGRA